MFIIQNENSRLRLDLPTDRYYQFSELFAPLASFFEVGADWRSRLVADPTIKDGDEFELAIMFRAPAPAPAPAIATLPCIQAAPAPEPGQLTVLVKYGTGNSVARVVSDGTTIGQLLARPDVKGALGYGDSVQGFVSGVPQGANITLRDGDSVSVHDIACKKA